VSRDLPGRAELVEKLCQAGRQLSTATVMFHQAIADRLGLNPTDHKCADLLILKGPLTAGELADLTGLTTGAITGVIDRLEKAGFVRREEDPGDRRRVIVRTIPNRLREVGRLFESLRAAMAEVSSHYSDRELVAILDFVTRTQHGIHRATLELREQGSGAGHGKRPRPEKR
jgi:DNA-binding MarR family transcriptional regulator